jgi:hypothetical protein
MVGTGFLTRRLASEAALFLITFSVDLPVPDSSALMYRNSARCPHCGRILPVRQRTPLINRSNGSTFHLWLFSGPDRRPKFMGGVYPQHFICNFACTYDQVPTQDSFVTVVITVTGKETVLDQIETAADRLTHLIEEGKSLTTVYTLNGSDLKTGFPN